jgi:hypothetical protein
VEVTKTIQRSSRDSDDSVKNATALALLDSKDDYWNIANTAYRSLRHNVLDLTTYRYRENRNLLNALTYYFDKSDRPEKSTVVITGFKSTVDLPYRCLQITTKRRFPNIEDLACFVVPAVSRTHVLLFWAYCAYEDVGWTEKKLGDWSWSSVEVPLKDEESVIQKATEIASSFGDFAWKRLSEKWADEDKADIRDVASEDLKPILDVQTPSRLPAIVDKAKTGEGRGQRSEKKNG